ncbi:hypothetical protein [Psychrobacillus sp. L3]|uniref:hypothetical protein n=1 Tax=Psychrobacillus sp. L3 TaxID=3236891 RepID=UPI0036F26BC0
MFLTKHRVEVVPESEYSDFSRLVKGEAVVPIAAVIRLSIYRFATTSKTNLL